MSKAAQAGHQDNVMAREIIPFPAPGRFIYCSEANAMLKASR
jgi:hypothetical protein